MSDDAKCCKEFSEAWNLPCRNGAFARMVCRISGNDVWRLPTRHAFLRLKGRLFCGFCRPFYKREKVKLLIAKRGSLLRGVARIPPSAVLLANSPFSAGVFR